MQRIAQSIAEHDIAERCGWGRIELVGLSEVRRRMRSYLVPSERGVQDAQRLRSDWVQDQL